MLQGIICHSNQAATQWNTVICGKTKRNFCQISMIGFPSDSKRRLNPGLIRVERSSSLIFLIVSLYLVFINGIDLIDLLPRKAALLLCSLPSRIFRLGVLVQPVVPVIDSSPLASYLPLRAHRAVAHMGLLGRSAGPRTPGRHLARRRHIGPLPGSLRTWVTDDGRPIVVC